MSTFKDLVALSSGITASSGGERHLPQDLRKEFRSGQTPDHDKV